MSIYLNKDSKIIVQGMTGGMGSKHTTLMVEAGSNIVGGVNARKAGTTVELGGQELPVFGNVKEASPRACPSRTPPRSSPTSRASPPG
jgi:succinyl-CoA synthetase alpha subunit